MSTIFNSLDKNFKTPIGPVAKDEVLTLRIKLANNLNPVDVQFIMYEYCASWKLCTFSMEYEKSDDNNTFFKIEISNIEINIYYYYFSFISNGKRKFLKMRNDSWEAYITDNPIRCDWQLTIYEPQNIHPNMQDGIMYQIFPDRFYKSDKTKNLPLNRTYRNWGELPYYSNDKIGSDFFGGDLNGIIQKLDYLKKLNISVLYLNPIWESASNHRYDTGSYKNVDPVLGDMEDLHQLVDKAHSLGMIIILDAVLNHTGSDSVYFNKYGHYPNAGAYQGQSSLFYNWYFFHNNKDNYESWWGFDTLPKVNQNNLDFIEYFFGIGGIIDKWYDLGIDGLRLDVADELENSTLVKIHDASVRNHNFITIIGEVWDNASNKCNYGHRMNYFLGKELTSVMNYPVKNALLAYIRYGGDFWVNNLKRTLLSIFVEDYPREIAHSLMNFLSSHDTVRAITKLAGPEVDEHDVNWQFAHDILSREEYILGRKRLMLSYFILYFLPGIPSIFYGDEIGISGQKDPFCRKCFTWNHIDKKILRFIKSLGKVRKSISNFLKTASFDVSEIDNSKCVFTRYSDDTILLIIANRTDSKISIDISDYLNNNRTSKYIPIFSLGNSSLTSLDSFGAIAVKIV